MNSISIFNAIRNECSQSFRDRIPKMSSKNINDIVNTIFKQNTYSTEYNEFVKTMINKLAFTLYRGTTLNNRWASYMYYNKQVGDIIEELFVQPATSEDYKPETITDNSTIDPNRITLPDVKAIYYSKDNRRKYRVTVFRYQLYKAFSSEGGAQSFINEIVNSLQKGSNLDEITLFKETINKAITNTKFTKTANMTINNNFKVQDTASARLFVEQVKNNIACLLNPSDKFNSEGAIQVLNISDIVVFLRGDIANTIQTALMSGAFNKTDLSFTPAGYTGEVKVEVIDDFGGSEPYKKTGSTYTKLFRVYDTYGKFTHLSETDGGGKYSGEVFYFNNYQMDGDNKPKKDICCLICDKNLPIISLVADDFATTYNGEGLYSNFVLHRWLSYGFSPLASQITIYEPWEIAPGEANIKVEPTFNFLNDDLFEFEKIDGNYVGEEFTFRVTTKDSAISTIINDIGTPIAEKIIINNNIVELQNSTTDGNYFIKVGTTIIDSVENVVGVSYSFYNTPALNLSPTQSSVFVFLENNTKYFCYLKNESKYLFNYKSTKYFNRLCKYLSAPTPVTDGSYNKIGYLCIQSLNNLNYVTALNPGKGVTIKSPNSYDVVSIITNSDGIREVQMISINSDYKVVPSSNVYKFLIVDKMSLIIDN